MPLPQIIVIGDTVKFTLAATADYSAPTWTRKVALRQRLGAAVIDVTGVANAGSWDFTITATQSATLVAGEVQAQDWVEKAAERFTLAIGTLQAQPNVMAGGANFDGRTQVQKDLDAVQAAIRAKIAGGDVQEYTIGSRSLKKMMMADLIALENKLRLDVARERRGAAAAQGLGNGRNVFVRF